MKTFWKITKIMKEIRATGFDEVEAVNKGFLKRNPLSYQLLFIGLKFVFVFFPILDSF